MHIYIQHLSYPGVTKGCRVKWFQTESETCISGLQVTMNYYTELKLQFQIPFALVEIISLEFGLNPVMFSAPLMLPFLSNPMCGLILSESALLVMPGRWR